METLTLEQLTELSELEARVPPNWREDACKKHDRNDARDDGLACYGVWTGDHHLHLTSHARFLAATRNALPSLLAMARRLVELESAIGFVRASGYCGSSIMVPEHILDWARELGWKP